MAVSTMPRTTHQTDGLCVHLSYIPPKQIFKIYIIFQLNNNS